MKKSKNKKYFLYILFGVYIVVVIWITLINRKVGNSRATLIPFWEYKMVINNQERMNYICQIGGNIALFIPFGFMLPLISRVHNNMWRKVLVCGLCFSSFIEISQYVTGRGWMEFDDVFNNTLGAVTGYGAYKLISRLFCSFL